MTTFIVILYLFLNITGRFSVAMFGLTYNLVDDSVTKYPTLTTRWNPSVLTARNATDFENVELNDCKNSTFCKVTSFSQQLWLTLHVVSYLDLVRGGLSRYGYAPEIGFNISKPQILREPPDRWLGVSYSGYTETDGNVSFEYYLPDFAGENWSPVRSNHAVHTSARCTMLRLDGSRYWRDYTSENQTSKGMLYKSHG